MPAKTMPVAAADAEYPPRADLRKDIYKPFPAVEDAPAGLVSGEEAMRIASELLATVDAAIAAGEEAKLASCFLKEQSFWKDNVALTAHFRTFYQEAAPRNLLKMAGERGAKGFQPIPGTVRCVPAMPTLTWIDGFCGFATSKPDAQCSGMFMLLPEKQADGSFRWKIWTFSTFLEAFSSHGWDPERMKAAPKDYGKDAEIDTDVFIVGGGNSGIILGARLKELGVDYLVIDQNARHGDNWRLRYDQMRFHISKGFVDTPYISYSKDVPRMMTRDHLADQVEILATQLGINVMLSTTVASTTWDEGSKRWVMQINTPVGPKTVRAKHLVQATGIGSREPYVPELENKGAYKRIELHSSGYKNAKEIAAKGAKSAVVVGSANTGFDLMEDCAHAGLQTTMVQRAPTYIIPAEYLDHPQGFGMYDHLPADVVDKITMGGPLSVGAQLANGLHYQLASAEPDRFKSVREKGLQVVDVGGDIMHNLLERAGGHYVQMPGATEMIAEGKVAVKSGVFPVAYTAKGLKMNDGSEIETDAILWATGFSDKNARNVAARAFGKGGEEIGKRMDATWCVDAEGEVRGLWKRQRDVDNFWVMGGFTSQQRYYSKFLALQIKGALEGILPEPYLDTA
ncbi:hypothetical protein DFJ74DRAFT_684858 [Hyaloraphidium curvatum]|nr:hypothetical protein DFJ74DRAFT_684858 [Hyaloraphidium curvatum]